MKNGNLSRVRIDTFTKGSTSERLDRLERILPIIVKAVIMDLSEIGLENMSEYGKKQLDNRIKEVIKEVQNETA